VCVISVYSEHGRYTEGARREAWRRDDDDGGDAVPRDADRSIRLDGIYPFLFVLGNGVARFTVACALRTGVRIHGA